MLLLTILQSVCIASKAGNHFIFPCIDCLNSVYISKLAVLVENPFLLEFERDIVSKHQCCNKQTRKKNETFIQEQELKACFYCFQSLELFHLYWFKSCISSTLFIYLINIEFERNTETKHQWCNKADKNQKMKLFIEYMDYGNEWSTRNPVLVSTDNGWEQTCWRNHTRSW